MVKTEAPSYTIALLMVEVIWVNLDLGDLIINLH